MILYRLPLVRLFFAALFLTQYIMPMDIKYRNDSSGVIPENIAVAYPLSLLAKPWYQRVLFTVSVIIRSCCCCTRSEIDDTSDDLDVAPTVEVKTSRAPHTISVPLLPSDAEGIEQYYRDSKVRLENSFDNAPEKAKDLLDMIKFPDLYREKVRIMVLYGPPGVAKSTLARAIAYKAGWFLELITGKQIRAKYRGETSINLQRKLEKIACKKQNTVVVIDEINRLFEQYNSSRHDTGDTAEDFWTFLDDQRKNKHFYIIGTTNHVDKLPPQIVSRLRNRFIKVTQPSTLDDVCRDFVRSIAEYHTLAPECHAEFLQQLLAPLHAKKCNIRDFESIEESAIRIARRANKLSPKLVFTQIQLQQAVQDMLDTDVDTKYGTEKLSEEDQNQENHRQHMQQQRDLHTETIQFQKDQFVKGVRVQKAMQTNQKSKSSGGGISAGAGGFGANYSWNSGISNESFNDDAITNHLSDEEIRLYREQLNTAELRNRECDQVKQSFEPLQVKVDALRMAKQQLSVVQNDEVRGLIRKIDAVISTHTTCHTKFIQLKVPSQQELAAITQEIVMINQAVDTLKSELETYARRHPADAGCVIL